jgi:hypothetical protein
MKFKNKANMLPKDHNLRAINLYQKHTSKSSETIPLIDIWNSRGLYFSAISVPV